MLSIHFHGRARPYVQRSSCSVMTHLPATTKARPYRARRLPSIDMVAPFAPSCAHPPCKEKGQKQQAEADPIPDKEVGGVGPEIPQEKVDGEIPGQGRNNRRHE